ncbi:MAG: ribosomal RNA small subunit methyltransferase E [Candidatus Binatia bacterium]|nr:MAG: ribosomal RNA small subunit methyltransferase E [Candidatus Binatia bacterium]
MTSRTKLDLPRFFFDPSDRRGDRVVLRGEEFSHVRARRVRRGDTVALLDGSGKEYEGRVQDIGRKEAVVEIVGVEEPPRETALRIVLVQAVLAPPRVDLLVEKATELGVAEIRLFTSERTVVAPSKARLQRWRRIAREAAKQSGRLLVPTVGEPLPYEEVLERTARETPARFLLHPEGDPFSPEPPPGADLAFFVGPEGGFTSGEVRRAREAGLRVVRLGPRRLRAETAAIVAVALAELLWGDFLARGTPPP